MFLTRILRLHTGIRAESLALPVIPARGDTPCAISLCLFPGRGCNRLYHLADEILQYVDITGPVVCNHQDHHLVGMRVSKDVHLDESSSDLPFCPDPLTAVLLLESCSVGYQQHAIPGIVNKGTAAYLNIEFCDSSAYGELGASCPSSILNHARKGLAGQDKIVLMAAARSINYSAYLYEAPSLPRFASLSSAFQPESNVITASLPRLTYLSSQANTRAADPAIKKPFR